ncbi:MAG TPA: hypothetical protein VG838_08850 [Opitutaceae bacterium]|nr:hypothetical protein [Opitutaceae bacterium]
MLSARDIVELLAIYLARRPRNEPEVLRQMQRRHAARQRDIDRHQHGPMITPKKIDANLPK